VTRVTTGPRTTALARVWIAAIGVTVGAVAGQGRSAWDGIMLALAGGAALAARRRPGALVAGLGLVGAGAGLFCAAVRTGGESPLASFAESVPSCHVSGAVLEQLGGLGTLVAATRAVCEGFPTVEDAGVVVLDATGADPGAAVSATGWLLPLGRDEFDIQRARLGAHARLDVREINLGPVRGPVPALAARIRRGLRGATAALEPRSAAIVRGLAIGDVNEMDARTEESLRRAGLSHLVAVSGSNVAIVLGAVAVACRRLGLRLRISLACGALCTFVAVVGPEPSVLRAALMGAVGLAAIAAGHRAEPLHALGIAMIVLLCFRPAMVFSVGLHLSAAATAGIVLWTAPIRGRLRRVPDLIALPLAATLAAQIAVAPILAFSFGELSLSAPLANLLVFPAVPIGTIAGLLAGVVGALVPAAGPSLGHVAAPAAGWIVFVGDRLGSGRWAAAEVPPWAAIGIAIPVVAAAVLSVCDALRAPEDCDVSQETAMSSCLELRSPAQ
jgi:competence protein ComEC